MKWIKKGLIFENTGQFGILKTHTQCPAPLVLEDRIRVYFSARMEDQQSLPVYIDINKTNPSKIIHINSSPILEFGRKGTFDENGITVGSVMKKDDKVFLYYLGWSMCKTVPYKNFIGLAVSCDEGKSFKKMHEAPVIPANEYNPIGCTVPTLLKNGNEIMAYYASIAKWIEIDSRLENVYFITYATSKDGVYFVPSGKTVIEPKDEFEASVRPAILKIKDTYHMWFSYRGSHGFREGGGSAYHIGYATSKDLINWERNDKLAGIEASETGWDSQMICYPAITQVGEKIYMFYNGNGFGKSGFGYAELVQ